MIAHLKLQIAGLRREQYGASAERSRRLLEQMELQLEELETDASEDDLAAEITAATGRRAEAIAFHAGRWDECDELLATTLERFGRLDVLVNNAGMSPLYDTLDTISEDLYDKTMAVNLKGPFRLAVAAGTHMVDHDGGSIINIGSMSGLIVNRPNNQPAYNASKAAVHHLTRSLAAEWAPYGVRVNAIAPGYVKTEMAPVDEPRFRQHWIEDAPMRRYATPEEIAPSVVYLASDAASFTTGAVLVTDGGYTLH